MHLKPKIARLLQLHGDLSDNAFYRCTCGWESMTETIQDHQAELVVQVVRAHLSGMIVTDQP